jgi:hypothetical protein
MNLLYSNDLQMGFKKGLGCGPAFFSVQQVVKYFTSRGSVTKGFRLMHCHLLYIYYCRILAMYRPSFVFISI